MGDATERDDVAALVAGADVVVSCLGNVAGGPRIMDKAAATILAQLRPSLGRRAACSSAASGAEAPRSS